MLVSNLAQSTGLSIDTIRFYEKKGLLNEQHYIRKENNYRDYSDDAIDRLLLIKQGQALGLTLREIGKSIDAWESETLTPEQIQAYFQRKLDDIQRRIMELEGLREDIQQKLTDRLRCVAVR